MFKKTKIAAVSAAVLGLSNMAAQADMSGGYVMTNDAGSEGQVLIFPYYNVNNSFITSFNITNTTADYKAIKVRFRESENSNDVLDFNVYMSPFDVFTMDLNKGSDDGVVLTTNDKTCTHPTIPEGGVLFRHAAYDSTDVADVREGYLEVIEMGVVSKEAYITDDNGKDQFITTDGILHEQPEGVPFDCSVINTAWIQGVFVQGGAQSNGVDGATPDYQTVNPKPTGYTKQFIDSDAGYYGQENYVTGGLSTLQGVDPDQQTAILPPTGGLVGSAILVDVENIAGYVAEPVSVQNYSTAAQHYLSSDENFYLLPSLASGSNFETDYNTHGKVARDWGMDDQDVLPRTSVPSGVNPMPISEVMLITALGNQYFLGTGTSTDYVVSAPMRKHAIYNDYKYIADDTDYDDKSKDIPVDGDVGDEEAPLGYWKYLDATDVKAGFVYYNREENKTEAEPGDFSPPLTTPDVEVPFEREVNILALTTGSGATSVLGSDNAQTLTLNSGFNNGWTQFSFTDAAYDLAGSRYEEWVSVTPSGYTTGVPLHGFMSARSGVGIANVGETFPHFYKPAGMTPAP